MAPSAPSSPSPPVRLVREELREGAVRRAVHPAWEEGFPWLVQGMTTRGSPDDAFDLTLFGRGATGRVMARWDALGSELGFPALVHGRQVHGAAVRFHAQAPGGLTVVRATDGHVTNRPGVLLTVSAADCVPIFLADPGRRAVALLHAGWRGTAAGILETGVAVLSERLASSPEELHVHLGPAICGACYEVGPEVHDALGLPQADGPTPVDLRSVLAARALEVGVLPGNLTSSAWCTRCGDSPFFSHRGGDPERQMGFLGVRE